MNQKERILQHMQTHGSITPLEALRDYGCFRLAARINDLRTEHDIETTTIERVNQFGDRVRFAEYRLKTNGQMRLS